MSDMSKQKEELCVTGSRRAAKEWGFLFNEPNPHKSSHSICVHCSEVIKHHGKLEKVKKHITKCHELPNVFCCDSRAAQLNNRVSGNESNSSEYEIPAHLKPIQRWSDDGRNLKPFSNDEEFLTLRPSSCSGIWNELNGNTDNTEAFSSVTKKTPPSTHDLPGWDDLITNEDIVKSLTKRKSPQPCIPMKKLCDSNYDQKCRIGNDLVEKEDIFNDSKSKDTDNVVQPCNPKINSDMGGVSAKRPTPIALLAQTPFSKEFLLKERETCERSCERIQARIEVSLKCAQAFCPVPNENNQHWKKLFELMKEQATMESELKKHTKQIQILEDKAHNVPSRLNEGSERKEHSIESTFSTTVEKEENVENGAVQLF